MEVLQFDPKKLSLWHTSVEMPTITKPDDVIIKVAYCGVCGTDLHIIKGKFPCTNHSIILGHEFSGVVHAVGNEVKNVKRGDRVGVDPESGCGLCSYCRTGNYHVCPYGALTSFAYGIFHDGGWAQYCKVPAKLAYQLPEEISLKQAVLLEPLSCICHGLSRIEPLPVGKTILITGSGIIGNLWCTLLYHLGHRKVIVSEPSKDRRELVKKLDFGFTVVAPSELADVASEGVDACIECSGNIKAMEGAFNLLKKGGKIAIFGVADPDQKISISPYDIFSKELTIVGVTINKFSYETAIGMVQAMGPRLVNYEKLGIKVFSMGQYKEALDILEKGEVSKAVFRVNMEME